MAEDGLTDGYFLTGTSDSMTSLLLSAERGVRTMARVEVLPIQLVLVQPFYDIYAIMVNSRCVCCGNRLIHLSKLEARSNYASHVSSIEDMPTRQHSNLSRLILPFRTCLDL